MTMTVAPSSLASNDSHPSGQPVPCRRLVRVALIQHRAALITIFVAFIALVIAIVIGRDAVNASYASYLAAGCTLAHPTNLAVCANTANQFADIPSFTPLVVALRLFPLVIGTFVGAPMVAREMESGTYRFAWTQGVGRTRLLLVTLATLALIVTPVAVVLGFLLGGWYVHPIAVSQSRGRQPLATRVVHHDVVDDTDLDIFSSRDRDVRRSSRQAHGRRDGSHRGRRRRGRACGRNIPFADLRHRRGRIVPDTPQWHECRADQRSGDSRSRPCRKLAGARVVHGPGRARLGLKAANRVGAHAVSLYEASNGYNDPHAASRWLALHHYTYWLAYQPADHFWMLQAIVGLVVLGLTVVCVLGTVRCIRERRAAR